MWRSMFKVMAATAAFGLVHSALASRTAKRAATRRFGERNRNGLYRVFYLAQSAVTFGMLASYIRRQPSRELYRVEGSAALLMHAVQAGAIVYATSAASQVGIRRIIGLERVWNIGLAMAQSLQSRKPKVRLSMRKGKGTLPAHSPGAATRSTLLRCRSCGCGRG